MLLTCINTVIFIPNERIKVSYLMKQTFFRVAILLLALCSVLPVLAQSPVLRVTALKISPDGRWIATGDTAGQVKLLNPAGETVSTFRGSGETVISLDWSPSGEFFVTADWDGQVEIWNISTRRLERTLRNKPGEIISVSWNTNPDYPYIAGVAQQEAKTYVWNALTGDSVYVISSGDTLETAWNKDGNYLATGGTVLMIWNVADGSLFKEMPLDFVVTLAWSPVIPDVLATTAYSTATDRYLVAILDLMAPRPLKTFTGFEDILAPLIWSPDGSKIGIGSQKERLRIWNISEKVMHVISKVNNQIWAFDWTNDNARIIYYDENEGMMKSIIDKAAIAPEILEYLPAADPSVQ